MQLQNYTREFKEIIKQVFYVYNIFGQLLVPLWIEYSFRHILQKNEPYNFI